MELGSLEVQIFVSLVVVLGTAFIALVCDFLKGNNEQLRERNIELRTRQDEREKLGIHQPLAWLQNLAALIQRPAETARTDSHRAPKSETAPPAPVAANIPAPAAVNVAAPDASDVPVTAVNWPSPDPGLPGSAPGNDEAEANGMRRRLYDEVKPRGSNNWASKDELEQLASRAARIRARHEATQRQQGAEVEELLQRESASEPVAPQPEPVQTQQAPEPPAMAAPIAAPVMTPMLVKTPEPVSEPLPELAAEPELARTIEMPRAKVFPIQPVTLPPVDEDTILIPEPVAEAVHEVQPEVAPVAASMEAEPAAVAAAEPVHVESAAEPQEFFSDDPAGDFIPPAAEATNAEAEAQKEAFPTGMQEASVLSRLLQVDANFDGVVVAIGINDYEMLKERMASEGEASESLGAVQKMITSMLRPTDFACRFQDDEFILLYPGEAGPAAQRRLFQVSEKLWDFQLRSLGQLSVIFSWGGLEAGNQPLSSAVAAARERLYQTKRSRRPPSSEASHRKVVNA